jgi:hypothetical protein
MAKKVKIYCGSCQAILTEDLGTRLPSAKFIPQLLTDTNRKKSACLWLLTHSNMYKPLKIINIVSSETWIYGYEPKTKYQLQWKSPFLLCKNSGRVVRGTPNAQ